MSSADRLALATLVAALVATGSAGATPPPRTVVSVPGVIRSFALGAGRVAWIETTWELRIRRFATGRTTTIRYTNQYDEAGGDPYLAFAGSRPLWLGDRGMADITDRVFTTDTAGAVRVLTKVVYADVGDGSYVTGPAGDPAGGTFGVVVLRDRDPSSGCSCRFAVTGGVWVVGSGAARRVPGLPPPRALARAGDRLLLAPAAATSRSAAPYADGTGIVEVRALPDGALVASFTPGGEIEALALTPRFAFVVVRSAGRATIEVHDPQTGALVRSLRVAARGRMDLPGFPPQVAAAGRFVVFHAEKSVSVLDGASGRVVTLARTRGRVTGVAATGTTVAWAEQYGAGDTAHRKGFTTVIRETTLPEP